MAGIGIITNPHSRRNRRFPEQMRRMGYVLGENDAYELTNRVEDVYAVAEKFKKSGIDILALNGGDGTNHVTLSTFIDVYEDAPLPKVAFLRGGTMNTVSQAIGISGTPSRLLANLVEKYYTGQPFETTVRHMLRVTGDDVSRYGFIFGNGLVSNFLELYYGTGNPSPAVAGLLLAKGVAASPFGSKMTEQLFRRFRASLEFDDESWEEAEYIAVLASTIEQIGMGFRPFIRAGERRGHFHLLGIVSEPLGLISQLPRIRLGLPVDESKMRSKVCRKVVLRSDEEILYTIDGDMHRANGEVIMEIGPRVEIIIK
jgi:diacylglycerol kinase family enzyme